MTYPTLRDASLAVGIPAIDREHAGLLAEFERLIGPPAVHLDSETFSEVISRLWHQLAAHFKNEEQILASCGLPPETVAVHRQAHWHILEQYTELQFDLMSSSRLDQAEVLSMLRTWLVDHLVAHDLKLRPYAPLFA